MKSVFYLGYGWLKYAPFKRFSLPEIKHSLDPRDPSRRISVPRPRIKGSNEERRADLLELVWAGMMSPRVCDRVPARILKNIPGFEHVRESTTLHEIIKSGDYPPLPQELPDRIAYHLAINRHYYYDGEIRHPVGVLPTQRIAQILDARFILTSDAISTARHLAWQAICQNQNPHFTDYDTVIRDEFFGIVVHFVRLFFFFVADYLYSDDEGFHEGEGRWEWQKLAACLFWQGRTGGALPPIFSGIQSEIDRGNYPDISARQKAIGEDKRDLNHVTGVGPHDSGWLDEIEGKFP